jgi:hypothetical protein
MFVLTTAEPPSWNWLVLFLKICMQLSSREVCKLRLNMYNIHIEVIFVGDRISRNAQITVGGEAIAK